MPGNRCITTAARPGGRSVTRGFVTLAALGLLAGSAAAQQAREPLKFVERPGQLEFSGELIVRPLQNQAAKAMAPAILGGNVRAYEPRLDHYMVIVPEGKDESSYATELMATGLFQYIHPNYICYPVGDPDDPMFGDQWHHKNIQSSAGWDMQTGTTDIIVAFTDTGIDLNHPDLAANRVPGYNAVDKKAEKDGGDVSDVMWHGTHVAGCAAAIGNNGIGTVGVAHNLSIMMCRVSNDPWGGSTFEILYDAAMWAGENGARVVSASYTGVQNEGAETTGAYLRSLGVLYLYAADNANQNHSSFDWPNVIVVGGTDQNDNKASFSSYGKAIDVVAPAVGILSTWIGGYGVSDGTSFATPIANGVCGLILSVNPGYSPDQVEQILFQGCDDIGTPGEDDIFGHGRVNVLKSLQLADPGLSVQVTQNAPKLIPPGDSPLLKIKIKEGNDTLVKGSETLYYSYDGGAFKSMPLVHLGGELYEVNLPAMSCGDEPAWYVAAQGVEGGLKTAPHNAPNNTYTASVGVIEVQTVASYGLNAGLPEGWTATGMWHVTDKCAKNPSCDGGTFLYYGQDAKCNFDNGQTNSGKVTMAQITLPKVDPAAKIELKFCAIRQDEGGNPYDDATILVNGQAIGQPGAASDWTANTFNLTKYAGQNVTIEFTYNTIDSIANDMLGLMIDGITIEASMVVCEDTCYADFDGNGQLNLFDFLAYTNAFNAGDKAADCTGDGALNLFDFLCYNNAFNAGC